MTRHERWARRRAASVLGTMLMYERRGWRVGELAEMTRIAGSLLHVPLRLLEEQGFVRQEWVEQGTAMETLVFWPVVEL